MAWREALVGVSAKVRTVGAGDSTSQSIDGGQTAGVANFAAALRALAQRRLPVRLDASRDRNEHGASSQVGHDTPPALDCSQSMSAVLAQRDGDKNFWQ